MPAKALVRYHYGPQRGGVAVPLKINLDIEEEGKQLRPYALIESVEFSSAQPDDSEFSLQQFGLPEPGDASKRPARLYVWLLLAAGACAALALLASRIARRRKQAS